MSDAAKRAKAGYEAKRIKKTVSFNADTEKDLLEIAALIPDFSGWVKKKIIDHADEIEQSQGSTTV